MPNKSHTVLLQPSRSVKEMSRYRDLITKLEGYTTDSITLDDYIGFITELDRYQRALIATKKKTPTEQRKEFNRLYDLKIEELSQLMDFFSFKKVEGDEDIYNETFSVVGFKMVGRIEDIYRQLAKKLDGSKYPQTVTDFFKKKFPLIRVTSSKNEKAIKAELEAITQSLNIHKEQTSH